MASFNKDQGSKSAWGTKSDKGAWGKGGGSDAGSSANRAGGGRGYAVRDSSASWGDSRKTGGGGAGGRGAVGGRGGAKTHHPRPTEKACEECNAPFCSPFACMMTKVKEFTEVQSLDDVAVPNSLNGTAYLKMCVAIKKISARKDKDELFSMPSKYTIKIQDTGARTRTPQNVSFLSMPTMQLKPVCTRHIFLS